MRLLLVDNNKKRARTHESALTQAGFAVDIQTSTVQALQHITINAEDYDALILHCSLPKKVIATIFRIVFEPTVHPPVFLLGKNPKQIIEGLNAGADGSVYEPYTMDEFIASLRAVLRRPKQALPPKLTAGQLILDPVKGEVTFRGVPLKLTFKEYTILYYLMAHAGQIISREELITHLWDEEYTGFSNVVDAHIKSIRRKLAPTGKELIKTRYGQGYILLTP